MGGGVVMPVRDAVVVHMRLAVDMRRAETMIVIGQAMRGLVPSPNAKAAAGARTHRA